MPCAPPPTDPWKQPSAQPCTCPWPLACVAPCHLPRGRWQAVSTPGEPTRGQAKKRNPKAPARSAPSPSSYLEPPTHGFFVHLSGWTISRDGSQGQTSPDFGDSPGVGYAPPMGSSP